MDAAVFLCSVPGQVILLKTDAKKVVERSIMLQCMISTVQQGLGGIGKITNQARLLLQWEIAIVDLRGILICLLGVYVILKYKNIITEIKRKIIEENKYCLRRYKTFMHSRVQGENENLNCRGSGITCILNWKSYMPLVQSLQIFLITFDYWF